VRRISINKYERKSASEMLLGSVHLNSDNYTATARRRPISALLR